jgi:hypothetical protein
MLSHPQPRFRSEVAGNLNWGGPDWTDLYCACSTSIYRVRMKVRGNPVAYMRMA